MNGSTTWLTVSEAARLAGVDVDTIRRWTRRGTLAHRVTPGGHRRIDRDELLRLVGLPKVVQTQHRSVYDAVEDWARQVEQWDDWEPEPHVSATELDHLRLTIEGIDGRGGLIAALRGIADRAAAAAEERIGGDTTSGHDLPGDDDLAGAGTGSQLRADLAHLLRMPLPRRSLGGDPDAP